RVERLSAGEARRLEPLLSPDIHGALLAPDDHVIDPRLLVRALREACARAGVVEVAAEAIGVRAEGGRAAGVDLDGGDTVDAPVTVLAAGAYSAALAARVETMPVRPVKGQLLVLRAPDGSPLLGEAVRGLAHGFSVYLVPRGDGRVVVGATAEERGFDTSITAEAVYTLLRDGRRLVPALTELELVECRAALRPGTPDNGPILGEA